MTSPTRRGARRGLMLLALGSVAAGAGAQRPDGLPPGAVVQPLPETDGAELRRHLTALAENPRSLEALVGAGRAALASGDAEAALAFFGRGDEISPRDARVKAGMASAFVQLGQAQAALSLFAQAAALGAPEIEIAGDRGLAFDMAGEPGRAQRDYALALRRRDDPELRRRLALSLAISGERDAALRAIDPQLRRGDRAAWRVQAFVLALTGDAAGAARTAARTMAPANAQAMAPFLSRLAALSPAQKAMAVHFGHFPSDGRAARAGGEVPADPGAVALAMGGPPPAAASPPTQARPTQRAAPARRRQGAADSSDPYRLRERGGVARRPETAPPPEPRRQEPPAETAARWAPPPSSTPPGPAPTEPSPAAAQAEPPPAPAAGPPPSPGFSLVPRERPPVAAEPEPERPALADIAALVRSLPRETAAATPAPTPAPPPPPPRREAAPRPPAHPARHWVQIAGGADRTALPREFARLRALAPDELGRRAAYTTPVRATNRLLVGPFASADEAQEFVNRLARREVAAFAWTSEAGQEIERLQTRR